MTCFISGTRARKHEAILSAASTNDNATKIDLDASAPSCAIVAILVEVIPTLRRDFPMPEIMSSKLYEVS
jgi:hypothetical protein